MINDLQNNPIGVFDSGVGGLTVVKELIKILPHENIIYFGDTARVPYGTKSKDTVIKFSGEIVHFLTGKNVKLILVACNTASAVALDTLRKKVNPVKNNSAKRDALPSARISNGIKVPVIGVIESGAVSAVSNSRNRKIGVIGTEATIKSKAYEKSIKKIAGNYKIVNCACPLFVPLAEEGWTGKKISRTIAGEYLKYIKKSGVDTVILGCTHYPLLKKVIGKVLGKNIKLIDSAAAVARKVKNTLESKKILNKSGQIGFKRFFVSDAPEKFKKLGRIFLGKKILTVSKVNIGE